MEQNACINLTILDNYHATITKWIALLMEGFINVQNLLKKVKSIS